VLRWHDEDGDDEPDPDEERPPRVIRYLYDREDILATFSDSGREIARYSQGPGIDEPLAEVRHHQTRFYHADALGSIIAVTDKHGHAIRDYYYSAFGVPEDHKGDSQPYRFTGREWDKEIGLYYYRARYYAPAQGRFLREDPLRFVGKESHYKYVNDNPFRWTDPLGLIEWPFEAPMPWNEGWENLPGSPTYGNWGGKGYSGGLVGAVGPYSPNDSMDECFKAHDECYGQRSCQRSYGPARRSCDRELLACLRRLPTDPRAWDRPAPDPSEAISYRVKATVFFWIWSRL
jgi:RHS repeat-associated protein